MRIPTRVETFQSYSLTELELLINEFIKENELVDIKYSSVFEDDESDI